jgi:hypothetical protein
MADDDSTAGDRGEQSFTWIWTVALVAGVASLALLALYYYWHQGERHILEDFQPPHREPAPRPAPSVADGAPDTGDEPAPEAGAA